MPKKERRARECPSMSRRVLFSVVTLLVYRVCVCSVAGFVTAVFVTGGFAVAAGQH